RVVRLSKQRAHGAVARSLQVESGCDVWHVLVVHAENDVPVQLEDRHVLADFARDFDRHDFTVTTPSACLSAIAPLQEAEQVVRAAMPNAAVQKHLGMPAGEPCLVVVRRTWAHGRPVSFSRLHHPGSRFELTGHYTPPGTPRSRPLQAVGDGSD
ncbi:MAG: UTRA domain-containing protein, partial [Woeseiaceae bacterium]|nr:UTRA domain-containing protein [Woeseiaceae bacterium]